MTLGASAHFSATFVVHSHPRQLPLGRNLPQSQSFLPSASDTREGLPSAVKTLEDTLQRPGRDQGPPWAALRGQRPGDGLQEGGPSRAGGEAA